MAGTCRFPLSFEKVRVEDAKHGCPFPHSLPLYEMIRNLSSGAFISSMASVDEAEFDGPLVPNDRSRLPAIRPHTQKVRRTRPAMPVHLRIPPIVLRRALMSAPNNL